METKIFSISIENAILRVDTFHESYRLLLYSPFWILNRTGIKTGISGK